MERLPEESLALDKAALQGELNEIDSKRVVQGWRVMDDERANGEAAEK